MSVDQLKMNSAETVWGAWIFNLELLRAPVFKEQCSTWFGKAYSLRVLANMQFFGPTTAGIQKVPPTPNTPHFCLQFIPPAKPGLWQALVCFLYL